MKQNKLYRIAMMVALPTMLLASCDYLDVLPPETVGPEDTMKDQNAVRDFLASAYAPVTNKANIPTSYDSYESSTDEFTLSEYWQQKGEYVQWDYYTATNAPMYWNNFYTAIGQTQLFMKQLDETSTSHLSDATRREYIAEAKFLLAYYHARLLDAYGPIPLMMSGYPSMNIPKTDIPGRSPYDECVDSIVKKLDEAVEGLPVNRGATDWGHADKTIAKAIKSRVLLYAASPMWNGQFPFPNWKNKDGQDLVSKTVDKSKWQRALDAALDAIATAEAAGHRLLTINDGIAIANRTTYGANGLLCWVPGIDETQGTDEQKAEALKFKQTVLALRYIQNTTPQDGNLEVIWGIWPQNDGQEEWTRRFACLPKNIANYGSNIAHGWTAENPTLYTVEHFNTVNGTLPKFDKDFPAESEWLKSAGIPNETKVYTPWDGSEPKEFEIKHSDVINLNARREARFYATLSFDGDEEFAVIRGGEPLWINCKSYDLDGKGDEGGQGYDPAKANRDYTTTGYWTKKWMRPELWYDTSSDANSTALIPHTLIRLAELYLNAAECYAELGDTQNALKYVNIIRNRAALRDLTEADLADQSIIEWVRNERFIELWGEGLRFYDVRRWLIAPDRLKGDAYEGLNSKVVNASFEEFNKRTKLKKNNPNLTWNNRMYLMAIPSSEVYSNPQLVQAPGY